MKKIIYAFFLISFAVGITACGGGDDKVTYESKIKSDLSGCATAGCHNAGSAFGSLASYTDVVAFIGFGRILGAVKHEDGFSPMPKGGDKWSDTKIKRLEDWITDGMPEK